MQAPAGAARVDLTGKTVIPALVDAHSHIGYMKNLTSGPQNYTRENILDHMYRFAYFGVAASQAMGSDFGELPFALRDEIAGGQDPGGRALPDGRPRPGAARGDQPGQHAPRRLRGDHGRGRPRGGPGAGAAEGADGQDVGGRPRRRRQEAVARTVRAIIDEAHKHGMRVAVHATGLEDAKALLRAGIDIFAHMIGDVDDELVALFKAHPNTVVLLGARRPAADRLRALAQPAASAGGRDRVARTDQAAAEAPRRPRPPPTPRRAGTHGTAWRAGSKRLHEAGVRIGVGTDGGGQLGDQFVGWTMHTEVENLVADGADARAGAGGRHEDVRRDPRPRRPRHIAPGKSADFVVLDANPLVDITNTRAINRVYLRGTQVDRTRLRAGFTAR